MFSSYFIDGGLFFRNMATETRLSGTPEKIARYRSDKTEKGTCPDFWCFKYFEKYKLLRKGCLYSIHIWGFYRKKRSHKITRKKLKHKEDSCLALLRNCTSNSAVRILTSKYTFLPLEVTPEMTHGRCGTLTPRDLNTGIQGYRNRCHQ